VTAAATADEFEATSSPAAAELSWAIPLVAGPEPTAAAAEISPSPEPARWPQGVTRRLAITDTAVLLGAVVADVVLWNRDTLAATAVEATKSLGMLLALTVGWLWTLGLFRTRSVSVLGHGSREFNRVLSATIAALGVVAGTSLIFDVALPRRRLLPVVALGFLGVVGTRLIWRAWIAKRRRHGAFITSVLGVGDHESVSNLAQALRSHEAGAYRMVGACVGDQRPTIHLVEDGEAPGDSTSATSVPVLGAAGQALALAERLGVDAVVVTDGSGLGSTQIQELGRGLHAAGIRVVHVSSAVDASRARIDTEELGGRQFVHIAPPTFRGASGMRKRLMDLLGSSVLIVLLSPVLAGIALAVKLTSPGPVFFRQERIGIGERPFRMIKFRSMTCDAEARLADVMDIQDMGNAVMFKARNDPRVTRVGRVIRKLSLDELPQLFNVWKSEMSLVGPRPPLPSEVAKYDEANRRRFLVKPGMTGLWQVSGRSDLDWSETTRLDQYYVDNWSAGSDVAILCRTFKAATKGV
jgi:exopolysaccharide biosynthesis polyprenyl glycosylphosphotransferase